jgi:hypothetical protein
MKHSDFTALKAANDNPVPDKAIRDLFEELDAARAVGDRRSAVVRRQLELQTGGTDRG